MGLVPRLHRYNEELRLPIIHPAALRCLHASVTVVVLLFASACTSTAHADLDPIISDPPESSTEMKDLPGSWRTSRVQPAPLFDPGRISALGPTARVDAAPALAYGGRSRRLCFRGSITQQLHSLCTLRSVGCPIATQHSVPGGGHLSRAAVVNAARFVREVSASSILPPLPGLAWRTCQSVSVDLDVDFDVNLNVNATLGVVVDVRSSS